MRITTPRSDARVPLDEIDLADTDLYATGDAHLVWKTLRTDCPVFWQSRPNSPGFWAVTRWGDVRQVLGDDQKFTSENGTAISMLGAPDPAAGKMMQATDPPAHHHFRRQLGKPFSPNVVPSYSEQVRLFIREAMRPMKDGGIWDIAKDFARLPMAVGAMLMGLPTADIDRLLGLAYASLAPLDPRYCKGSEKVTVQLANYELIEYFSAHIADRQAKATADLVSQLITMEICGRRLTETEILINCLSLILGAVVSTSHAISSTLITLAEQHNGEGRFPAGIATEIAVEEALRWSSPVTHFMRRARRDVQLQGQTIREGEAVTAWIASANRDESVFEQPFAFDLARSPNRHVTFGSGPHLCIGSHLARLMIRLSFEELSASVECFELAGSPSHLVSNEIAGVVSLPLRIKLRSAP